LRFGSIDRFITIIIERKSSENESNASNWNISIPKGNWIIIVVGIVIAAIGFAGTTFYGSQFVKQEVNSGRELPYTIPSHIKSALPIDLEIVCVVIGVIGFGIFTYGFATRVDKPLDFYPT
jgi:multisubunit Na+/H+ antiporter MnhB subunit